MITKVRKSIGAYTVCVITFNCHSFYRDIIMYASMLFCLCKCFALFCGEFTWFKSPYCSLTKFRVICYIDFTWYGVKLNNLGWCFCGILGTHLSWISILLSVNLNQSIMNFVQLYYYIYHASNSAICNKGI